MRYVVMLHGSTSRHSGRGFSLIEVMIAVLVLSVGLLGMAALMATSLRNGQSANYRTQAINLAYEVIDILRSDMPNMGYYQQSLAAGFSNPAVACAAASEPAVLYATTTAHTYPPASPPATYAHRHEINRWLADLCYTLPNGRGRIQIAPIPTTVAGGVTQATQYRVTVNVCWTDDRALTSANTCSNAAGDADTMITVTSSL